MPDKQKQHLDFFAKLIEAESGIRYKKDYYQLKNRLSAICTVLNMPDTESLFHSIRSNGVSWALSHAIRNHAVNHETQFFRDRGLYEDIKKIILSNSPWCEKHEHPFKAWSAACSFGQEVWSLGMLLTDWSTDTNNKFLITGTDLSEFAINRAKSGIYTEPELLNSLKPAEISRWFKATPDLKFKCTLTGHKSISFFRQNLLEPLLHLSRQDSFDLVLIRNTLLYFQSPVRSKVISEIRKVMRPGGYLALGAAETLPEKPEAFALVRSGQSKFPIYQTRD